jgi:hypothetical protein
LLGEIDIKRYGGESIFIKKRLDAPRLISLGVFKK